MLRTAASDSGAHRSGAVAIEFAVVAPLLILLTLGMIDVTRAAQAKVALSDAVRSGCRLAAEPRSTNDAVGKRISAVLTSSGIKASGAKLKFEVNSVVADVKTAKEGDRITVSVTIPLSDVGGISAWVFPAGTQQAETLSMVRQR